MSALTADRTKPGNKDGRHGTPHQDRPAAALRAQRHRRRDAQPNDSEAGAPPGSVPTIMSAVSSTTFKRPVALLLLRRSEHVLFGVLLVIGCFTAWQSQPGQRWLLLGGAAAVAAWYVAGMALARRSRVRWHALAWLLVLTGGCAGLVVGSAGFVWLSFSLFLLYAQLLPLVVSLPSVVVITGGTIAAVALEQHRLTAATVIGPLIGAAVAVVITLVYRDLAEQVRQRAALIEQLTATRDELAVSQRQAGVLSERERLAREIHDTITQSLTSIVLVLRTARDQEPARAQPLHSQLDTVIDAAQTALTDTRRLVADLTPAELSNRSLPDALRRVIADHSDLHVVFDVEGEPRSVPTPVAVALLRAAQETLANAGAHADADQVHATCTFLPDVISLDVVDDGVGFDPQAPLGPTTGTGLGLPGLRARASEVGGSISIDSAPGRGTAINVSVPSQPRNSSQSTSRRPGDE